jgi:hypothetical protein
MKIENAIAAVLSRGSTDETKCDFPRLLRIVPGDAPAAELV